METKEIKAIIDIISAAETLIVVAGGKTIAFGPSIIAILSKALEDYAKEQTDD